MHYLYILYSNEAGKFYIGSTSSSPDDRLLKHLHKHKGFTAQAKDWKIIYTETFESIQEARARERQLKAWKSSNRIRLMIQRNPES